MRKYGICQKRNLKLRKTSIAPSNLGASIMDHSCAPNAAWISKGKELIIKCISEENIENISDLRISYIPNLYESTERRRDLLMEDYYFECQCSRLDNL